MKKALTIVTGLMVALSMAACGSTTEPNSKETVYVDSGSTSQTDLDAALGDLIREETGLEGTDAEWASAAKATCRSFDNGTTFEEMVDAQVESGFSEYNVGFIIGASVGAYCPEHADLFE